MNGILVLADGTLFTGVGVGASGVVSGEAVFNTSMAGYQEVFSDPSYAGQVVVMTSPHIGNYGVTELDDQAAAPHCSAVVMRSITDRPSSWRSEGSLHDYLAERRVVGLQGVDTRRLTRHLRAHGSMPAAVGVDVDEWEVLSAARSAPRMDGRNLVDAVTTAESYELDATAPARGHVVAYDLGIKSDILGRLTGAGLAVTVVPAATPASAVLSLAPDGVFLSNGPGDPAPLAETIDAIGGLLGTVPVFGICLGHQLLGLALGATTFKLPFGHHGGNHPVRNLETGRVAITAQNHGFAVDLWSLTDQPPPARSGLPSPDLLPGPVAGEYGRVVATHQNLNDGTLEGLACLDVPAFGVQFHPEAAPGPQDAVELFDRFVTLMRLA